MDIYKFGAFCFKSGTFLEKTLVHYFIKGPLATLLQTELLLNFNRLLFPN